MNLSQHLAAVALWQAGSFDTAEIAALLHVPEGDVANLIAIVRDAEREPELVESDVPSVASDLPMCVVLPFAPRLVEPCDGGAA